MFCWHCLLPLGCRLSGNAQTFITRTHTQTHSVSVSGDRDRPADRRSYCKYLYTEHVCHSTVYCASVCVCTLCTDTDFILFNILTSVFFNRCILLISPHSQLKMILIICSSSSEVSFFSSSPLSKFSSDWLSLTNRPF